MSDDGTILLTGSDADMVLVDMEKEVTLSKGKILVENGEFKGAKESGEFVKRRINREYLERFGLN